MLIAQRRRPQGPQAQCCVEHPTASYKDSPGHPTNMAFPHHTPVPPSADSRNIIRRFVSLPISFASTFFHLVKELDTSLDGVKEPLAACLNRIYW